MGDNDKGDVMYLHSERRQGGPNTMQYECSCARRGTEGRGALDLEPEKKFCQTSIWSWKHIRPWRVHIVSFPFQETEERTNFGLGPSFHLINLGQFNLVLLMPTQLTRNVHTELRTAYLVFEIHSWGGVGCPSMEMLGRRIEAKGQRPDKFRSRQGMSPREAPGSSGSPEGGQ